MRVAYVLRSWPRLSQTFVLGEVLALERSGVALSLFAMTRSGESLVQPRVAEVRAPVRYLDARAWRGVAAHGRVAIGAPRRYLGTLGYALRHRELRGGYTQSSAVTAFDKAVLVADGMSRAARDGHPFTHIHAHFAHDPALVGLLAHRLTGLPFTFTAHARDLYQIPDAALLGRAREADAVVTCCRANLEHIEGIVESTGPPVELIYHGVDLTTFRPPAQRNRHDIPVVISVGRLVEKKGFDDLLHAFALLRAAGVEFSCDIYGDGPCRSDLEALRVRLGLDAVVRFHGECTQGDLVCAYQDADVFALTPRVLGDGDRDGVPNVVVEAMACGAAVMATDVGGIPELVATGRNGSLAPAGDVDAIAARLGELLRDARLRHRLGAAAARTAALFDSEVGAQRLSGLFRGSAHQPQRLSQQRAAS